MNSKKIAHIGVVTPNYQQQQMMIALKVKILCMYIGRDLVFIGIDGSRKITKITPDEIRHWSIDKDARPALTRLRDITPDHEDIFVDFAQALQTVQTINSNEDIERAVTAFSMAANRLRDLGYDCDGLIDAGLAIDLKLVTVN